VRRSTISTENTILGEAMEVILKMVSHMGYKEGDCMEDSS